MLWVPPRVRTVRSLTQPSAPPAAAIALLSPHAASCD
jgi:hypothetical protein